MIEYCKNGIHRLIIGFNVDSTIHGKCVYCRQIVDAKPECYSIGMANYPENSGVKVFYYDVFKNQKTNTIM